jgi:hypothetical protein
MNFKCGKTINEDQIGVPLCIPARGLQSQEEPSWNGGWAASYGSITGALLEIRTCLHFLSQKVMSTISRNSNVFCP